MRKKIGFFLGPFLFLILSRIQPEGLDPKASYVLGLAAWMIIWWSLEAVDLAVTALLPPIIFPLTGVFEVKQALIPYSSPIVFLFLGGFMLAAAMQKWHLHERISLHILKYLNKNAFSLIAGFAFATAFISMWISNTAAALMMIPIAASVIQKTGQEGKNHFATVLMLTIGYSAGIGGTATLIGTPPNVAFAGLYAERYGQSFSFSDWLPIGIPFALLMLIIMIFLLGKILFPLKEISTRTAEGVIEQRLRELGKIQGGERLTIAIFLFTVGCWVFKDAIIRLTGFSGLTDHVISILGGVLLFCIPFDVKTWKTALAWENTKEIPWGILILFGGGLSLAAGLESTGIVRAAGEWLTGNREMSSFSLILILSLTSLFATELMSNVALVNIFIPVVFGIADAGGSNPLMLGIPVTLAASCAFMFPVSTPPNAVIFSTGKVSMGQMIKAGIWMNLTAILIIQFLIRPIVEHFVL
jgi:sodium-dependent dicarboxylate transporter 2/3/5